MSNIEFEDKYTGPNPSVDSSKKGIVGWMINKGLVKNQKTAEMILLIIAVIFFALSIFLFIRNFSGSDLQQIESPNIEDFENY